MGSGEYEGKFVRLDYGWLDLIETHRSGDEEEHSWQLTDKARKQASALQPGDHIIVEVEFERYKVCKIWGPDSGRMLRQRIDLLTKALAAFGERFSDATGDYLPPEMDDLIKKAKDLE